MKKGLITFVLIVVIVISSLLQAQTDSVASNKFEIVYQADVQYALNDSWLNKIRDDWKATGINLRIFRYKVEKYDSLFAWNDKLYDVDDALTKIADAGLDIYLRLSMASLDSWSIKHVYNDDDFDIRSNGKKFLNEYEINNPILNLTSPKSLGDMLNFVGKVVNHLNSLPDKIRNRIRLIVPAISPDDETEFPFNTYNDSTRSIINDVLTGYSRPEISAFMKFLENRYSTIDSLDTNWGEGAKFTDFDPNQIQIKNYNWDGIKSDPESPDYYKYLNGRKDFLDFRREELKNFIDNCNVIVKEAGYKFGVQFGSIYDGLIEFRGFYDPTPLIENVDMLITDDILEYYPNYSFSADYSRSLCKYWTWKNENKEPKEFATEINWFGYGGHSPEELIKYWSLQLRTFYEKGASCLFVSQWGTVAGPGNVAERLLSGSFKKEYSAWQDTLKRFQNAPVKIVDNDFAFNLACEQGLNYRKYSTDSDSEKFSFIHNEGLVVGNIEGRNILEFPLCKFSKTKGEAGANYYKGNGDFVTNFMLLNSPGYLQVNYKNYFLTGTSSYTPIYVKSLFK